MNTRQLVYNEVAVDLQRKDNGHQFKTTFYAETLDQALVAASIKFPESKVLIVWMPNVESESMRPSEYL